jgi:hypothetical protein
MRIVIPHHTTQADARVRVETKLAELVSQFGDKADDVSYEWQGDTLRFRGKARGLKVEGTVEVTDLEVIFESSLPFMARPFEPRIRQAVMQEAEKIFRA